LSLESRLKPATTATQKNKKTLSERDICTKFITPALVRADWDPHTQIREEVSLTRGRMIVRGRMVARGKARRADYVLYQRPNLPIAVVEAKDNSHPLGGGMGQALDYAQAMDVPFASARTATGFYSAISPDGPRIPR